MPVEEKSKIATVAKCKVVRSEKLGRHLLATKNIAAGEVILRENPIAVGPIMFSKDIMCFECLRVLPKDLKENVYYICSKCKVAPLCNSVCEEEMKRHTLSECEIFRSNGKISSKHISELINILLPLRLYLLREKQPELWEKIEHMEAHIDERRGTAVWRDRHINVINVIRTHDLIPGEAIYITELFQHLCGILDVNTFELRSPGSLDALLLRGLYIEASLMAHNCRGNTHLTVDDHFQLTIYASLPIEKDQPIYYNYTSSLLGTTDRREHLREGKYFECDCSLCKDPYEMGSHLSTILCPRCKEGLVGIQNPLVVNPYELDSKWQCNTCRRAYSGRLIRTTLTICRNLIDDFNESDIKGLESLIKKLSKSLHSNHFLMLSLKQKLLAAYRKEVASSASQKKTIQKMLDMCKEVFKVLEIVEPGISRLKGIMLYEMHMPLVLLANRNYAGHEISSTELASQLEEARNLLKKALTMLLLEPVASPEGRLAKRALQELKILSQNIVDVRTLPSEETKTHGRKSKENRRRMK